MSANFVYRRDNIKGKRVSATKESDSAPIIGSIMMPVLQEAPAPTSKPKTSIKTIKFYSIIGTILLWIPVLSGVGYFLYTCLQGKLLNSIQYLDFIISLRVFHTFGGIFLLISARQIKKYAKPIGWLLLAMMFLPFVAWLLFGRYSTRFSPSMFQRKPSILY